MATSAMPEQLLSREATAAYLNIGITTLDRLIESGELTPIRISKKCVRFSKQMVDDFQSQRTSKNNA